MKQKHLMIRRSLLAALLAAAVLPLGAHAQQCVAGGGESGGWYPPSCQTP
jgi:hypothetical protein